MLKVRTPEWVLEEDERVLRLGEAIESWLTFTEVDLASRSAQPVQVIRGSAQSLPHWPGGLAGHHPVRIDLGVGALYWDAPSPVDGEIEVHGIVSTNNVDAPEGFPVTRGLVRGLRMEWQEMSHQVGAEWSYGGDTRYEEVEATYLPSPVTSGSGPITRWTAVLMDVELQGFSVEGTTVGSVSWRL